ncbi:hypothetical protein VE02_04358 [Pseudogymnoascus sp. 03VT05]|nr:hypothetical protein VE02_04358 [Pseudogymnoascus sp. 03VT05]
MPEKSTSSPLGLSTGTAEAYPQETEKIQPWMQWMKFSAQETKIVMVQTWDGDVNTLAASETEPYTTFVQYKLACLAIERGNVEEAIPSLERILIICRLRERAKGDKGEIARVTRTLADAVALQGDTSKAARLIAESEKMRKEIQSERKWQPPDEKRAYDILVWNEYW